MLIVLAAGHLASCGADGPGYPGDAQGCRACGRYHSGLAAASGMRVCPRGCLMKVLPSCMSCVYTWTAEHGIHLDISVSSWSRLHGALHAPTMYTGLLQL